MSQKITEKIKVTGELVAQVPIAVGGMGGGDAVDLDVAVDGQGRFYIPGSSLAGPIRAWASANLQVDVGDCFGSEKTNEGRASLLFIEDAPTEKTLSGNWRERRHGVSIRRDTGTAEDGKFYTRALLPKGTSFKLEMELDLLDDSSEKTVNLGILRRVLEALSAGEIRFGACKTRGFGTLRLENLTVARYDFSTAEVLDLWLDGKLPPQAGLESLGDTAAVSRKSEGMRYVISVRWRPVSGIMVKSGRDGIESDMLPLISRSGEGLAPVLPGSSLKGALRAHARKILQTLFDGGCEALHNDLFGSEESAGRLYIDDVYCTLPKPLTPSEWQREDKNAMESFGKHRQHVAIDRFTGGASDGALYSVRPVDAPDVDWDPITITVDFSRGDSSERKNEELALLELLLQDMKKGRIPLGFGTRRGLGEIEIESIEWQPSKPKQEDLREAWLAFVANDGQTEREDKVTAK